MKMIKITVLHSDQEVFFSLLVQQVDAIEI